MTISLARHKILCVALAFMLVISALPGGFGQTQAKASGQLETKDYNFGGIGVSVVYGYSEMRTALGSSSINTVVVPEDAYFTIGHSAVYIDHDKTLEIHGKVEAENGSYISNDGTMNIQGTLHIENEAYRSLENSGSIEVSGELHLISDTHWAFYNNGTMDVSGTMYLDSSTTMDIRENTFYNDKQIIIQENGLFKINSNGGNATFRGFSGSKLVLAGGKAVVYNDIGISSDVVLLDSNDDLVFLNDSNNRYAHCYYGISFEVFDGDTGEQIHDYKIKYFNSYEYKGQTLYAIWRGEREVDIQAPGYPLQIAIVSPIASPGARKLVIYKEPFITGPTGEYPELHFPHTLNVGKEYQLPIDFGTGDYKADYVVISLMDKNYNIIRQTTIYNDQKYVTYMVAEEGEYWLEIDFYQNDYLYAGIGQSLQVAKFYPVSVSIEGQGFINYLTEEAVVGDFVDIDVYPEKGWKFDRFELNPSDLEMTVNNLEYDDITFTWGYFFMPAQPVHITVVFKQINESTGNNSGGGSSGSSGSKGRSGPDTYASSLLNRQDVLPVKKDIAVADAKQALAAAKSQGNGKATMKIQNATSISLNVMKSISNEAKTAKLPLIVQADTVQNGIVQVRLSFDPKNATKDIQLSGSVSNTSVQQV